MLNTGPSSYPPPDKWSPYPSGTMPVSQEIPFSEATISRKKRKEASHGTDGNSISPVIAEYLRMRAAGKRQDGAGEEKRAACSGSPAAMSA